MPRAPGSLEERLTPNQQGLQSSSAPPSAPARRGAPLAVAAGLLFLVLDAVRLLARRRQDHALTHIAPHPASVAQLSAPLVRLLLLAPLLAACSCARKRDGGAPPAPVRVPYVAILCLAALETAATYGFAATTDSHAPADAVFTAVVLGWISLPLTLALSRRVLQRGYQRGPFGGHYAAAAAAAVGVAVGVALQLHALAGGGAANPGEGVGSAAAVASSVTTAVGMAGLPLGLSWVWKEAVLERTCPSTAATRSSLLSPATAAPEPASRAAAARSVLSLAVWEALFTLLLQGALLPIVYSSEHGTLRSLPDHVANGTRCLLETVDRMHDDRTQQPDPCDGAGAVFLLLAVAEAGSRLAGLALIRVGSAGSFAMVSTLTWPMGQLLSTWHAALGDATVAPSWHCDHATTPGCILPFGPLDVASLAVCAAALGLWCVSSNRQAQQDAAARDAAAVSAPTAGSEDEPEWEAVVEEVVGLRREGVWCLAVLLVGLVVLGVGLFLAWVTVLTRAVGCLFRSRDCTHRSTLWLWVVALLPLLLLGGAAVLRWQRRRSGERRRQESLAQPGAVRATLHVYDWSGAQVPLIAKFNDLLPSLGMYHTGLELQGREYAYGANETGTSGMYSLEPRAAAAMFGHRHRAAVDLGAIAISAEELRGLLRSGGDLERAWMGGAYSLLQKNCNHFTEDLCEKTGLGAERPGYTNRLAAVGRVLISMAKSLQKWV